MCSSCLNVLLQINFILSISLECFWFLVWQTYNFFSILTSDFGFCDRSRTYFSELIFHKNSFNGPNSSIVVVQIRSPMEMVVARIEPMTHWLRGSRSCSFVDHIKRFNSGCPKMFLCCHHPGGSFIYWAHATSLTCKAKVLSTNTSHTFIVLVQFVHTITQEEQ